MTQLQTMRPSRRRRKSRLPLFLLGFGIAFIAVVAIAGGMVVLKGRRATAPSASAGSSAEQTATSAETPAASGAGSTPASAPVSAAKPQASDLASAAIDSLQPPDYEGYELLPILTYHEVNPKGKADITITPGEFEAQLRALKEMGYTTIDSVQLAEHMSKGTALPGKPVMITFDDGWKSQYQYAAPLLEKYGMTAVYFVYPKMIGGGGAFMVKDQVVDLAKRGFDIQSHTWGHMNLVRKPGVTLRGLSRHAQDQYTKTDAWIEDATGAKPIALAYPYGVYDLGVMGLSKFHGIKLAFTVDEGVADARAWDALALKRMTIYRGSSVQSFKRRVTSQPLQATNIQPPPGSRVVGRTTEVSADITDVPADVKGIHFASGNSMGATKIVERDGRRIAVAKLKGANAGFRNVTLMGTKGDTRYINAWGLVMGD